MDDLTDQDRRILTWLGKMLAPLQTGEVARLIGRQPGKKSTRQHSAYVRKLLLSLESQGLVMQEGEGAHKGWSVTKSGRAAAMAQAGDGRAGA